ncbi:tRNA uridine-5-carboxymethylaminomethyl(34) synthesis enzyme MnmG [Alphaproteobacteria bacterium]|nr:tRNA uridine-5-carboxymethylaminomethyl(34) synthesis enzyme MnmG [Alphaproteobacteria bacterium]
MKHDFDIIVVGAGHAGIEAANICNSFGMKTALVTNSKEDIGQMSCNPSIGGVGKTHIAREVDIMGGLICKIGDLSSIHYRVLNLSKGPAVWGIRAQIDRSIYQKNMFNFITKSKITIIEDEVTDILTLKNKVIGVNSLKSKNIYSKATILTTGTFLNGKIYFGDETIEAGRINNKSSKKLALFVKENFQTMRLKTGTPPRIYKKSIDYTNLNPQPSENNGVFLSFFTEQNKNKMIDCYITKTNKKTHKVIRDNLNKSAMYSGIIKSQGVRYCPSIEDKVVKFGDRNGHNIFLEPEGYNSELVYPNGISNSLDKKTQEKFLKTIPGLEKSEIAQYGYAVEYDAVDPRCLNKNFETKKFENFFLAGQINGTTGYEEAAGQGMYAGMQASLKIKKNKVKEEIFNRTNSYIGVMVDDLTKLGVTEPYRMFTSRSEHRLKQRTDNAYERIYPKTKKFKLLNLKDQKSVNNIITLEKNILEKINQKKISPNQLLKFGIKTKLDGKMRTGFEVLKLLDDDIILFKKIFGIKIEKKLLTKIIFDSRYEVFYDREEKAKELIMKNQSFKLRGISYKNIPSLSKEIIEKLEKHKPENLDDASKISGMTPSALLQLLSYKKHKVKNVRQ